MKNTLLLIAANAVSLTLAIGAIIMALNHVKGWGWLVVASILLASNLTFRSKQE